MLPGYAVGTLGAFWTIQRVDADARRAAVNERRDGGLPPVGRELSVDLRHVMIYFLRGSAGLDGCTIWAPMRKHRPAGAGVRGLPPDEFRAVCNSRAQYLVFDINDFDERCLPPGSGMSSALQSVLSWPRATRATDQQAREDIAIACVRAYREH